MSVLPAVAMLAVASCASPDQAFELKLGSIEFAGPAGSAEPNLFAAEDGRLLMGIEFRSEFPLVPNATATVLTPAFFKRGVRFRLPNPLAVIDIPSRPARRLELRTMTYVEENLEEDPAPIVPEGVRVGNKGLTLVRRTLDGQVVFQGAVPETGEVIEIYVRGYLPREVTVPPYTREATSVDLGEIAFVRGLEKKIVFKGVDRQLPKDLRVRGFGIECRFIRAARQIDLALLMQVQRQIDPRRCFIRFACQGRCQIIPSQFLCADRPQNFGGLLRGDCWIDIE